jgi:hypothetical protein
MKTKQFLLCVTTLLMSMTAMADTYYVKTDGNDAKDGTSWENAKATIAEAINAGAKGDQIFVAQGTYPLTEVITLRNGINIYGGFAGTETSLAERPHLTFGETSNGQATIIDAQGSENELRRAIHQTGAFNVETILDGLVIENGVTTDVNQEAAGGGVYLDVNGHLNNSTVRYCRSLLGGGIYCRQDATVSNCLITGNRTLGKGGGIACSNGSQAINCYIINNTSDVEAGGAYAGRDGSRGSSLINCLIANNTAALGGGAYCSIAGIVNCTIVNNYATDNGGGLLAYENYPAVINCIIWGNVKGENKTPVSAQLNGAGNGNTKSVINSAIQGGYGGNGASNITNLEAANSGTSGNLPEFIKPSTVTGRSIAPAEVADILNADWRIKENSVVKNKGTDNVTITGSASVVYLDVTIPESDLNGHDRINESVIDLGAYEYTVLSMDATLADLIVSAGTLTPEFTSATTEYTVIVDNSISSITLDAIENQFNAKISGSGLKTLQTGNNTFQITVTAEDRVTQQTYTIVVTRNDGTAIDKVDAVSVKVYPNPVTDKLWIETAGGALPEAKLYNLQGKLLLQTVNKEVDLSGFSNGIYLLKVNDQVIKIVKK